jgi:hypothetical protein
MTMITLYHRPADELGEALAEALQELVIAHQVQLVTEQQNTPLPLPYLVDGAVQISGADALWAYVRQLEQLMADWTAFQSDSCYIDHNSGTHC